MSAGTGKPAETPPLKTAEGLRTEPVSTGASADDSNSAGIAMQPVTVKQALALMAAATSPLPLSQTESLPLRQCLGRVLAQDQLSPIDVPAHDNAAMDGYAIASACLTTGLAGAQEVRLRVAGTALAGKPWSGQLRPGECVRIMTGAVMPAGCDTVLPHELTRQLAADCAGLAPAANAARVAQGAICFSPGAIKPGDNRRLRGEDLATGQVAVSAGCRLSPAHLGLLASLGLAQARVFRRLRVAFFSTGDELRCAGENLDPGAIYDSNRYTLQGMLERLGCETMDMGVVADQPDALESAMREACRRADVLITSGGVAAGDADHSRAVMARLGGAGLYCWHIAMRPGRPMVFGRLASQPGQAWLFGLPGNPVAAMISFYFLVRPALLELMGASPSAMPVSRVASAGTIRKQPGRTEYLRGIVEMDAQGRQQVRLAGAQGSGILRSMCIATCVIVLPDELGTVNTGDLLDVVYFEGLN